MGAESFFLIRPFAIEFLEELYQYYELIVFTAGVQEVRRKLDSFLSMQTGSLTKSTPTGVSLIGYTDSMLVPNRQPH